MVRKQCTVVSKMDSTRQELHIGDIEIKQLCKLTYLGSVVTMAIERQIQRHE